MADSPAPERGKLLQHHNLTPSDVGEAAYLAWCRRYERDKTARSPAWSEIGGTRRACWQAAAMAVVFLIDPTDEDDA